MLKILILSILSFIKGFEIINSVNPQFPKLLKTCNTIDTRLLDTTNYISDRFPQFQISYGNDTTGYICNQEIENYGYTYILKDSVEQNTNIFISNRLLYKTNTLYNVVLHEILHSMGLNHSDKQGMMNYSISISRNRYGIIDIIDDERKLWISSDDRKGLRFLRKLP